MNARTWDGSDYGLGMDAVNRCAEKWVLSWFGNGNGCSGEPLNLDMGGAVVNRLQ